MFEEASEQYQKALEDFSSNFNVFSGTEPVDNKSGLYFSDIPHLNIIELAAYKVYYEGVISNIEKLIEQSSEQNQKDSLKTVLKALTTIYKFVVEILNIKKEFKIK